MQVYSGGLNSSFTELTWSHHPILFKRYFFPLLGRKHQHRKMQSRGVDIVSCASAQLNTVGVAYLGIPLFCRD
jgi:hypothetical protein